MILFFSFAEIMDEKYGVTQEQVREKLRDIMKPSRHKRSVLLSIPIWLILHPKRKIYDISDGKFGDISLLNAYLYIMYSIVK